MSTFEHGEASGKAIAEDAYDQDELQEIDDAAGDAEDSYSKDSEDDVSPEVIEASLMERQKQKEKDIYVGWLHKEAVEDDVIKVFGIFGEIESVKIAKNPLTSKSKGFAFVRYATSDQARRAITELKDGTKVRGKKVRVSTCQDNDTLYLCNICKTWKINQVTDALEGYGIEYIENILLPDDPDNAGKIRGFALIEFSSHANAMAAFKRLRQRDAVFGCNFSAKVTFSQTSMQPSEAVMSKVKTVYIQGLPSSWDEDKLKEICKQHGEIQQINLPRNNANSKRNDIGFIAFTTREGAVSCIDGLNSAKSGEESEIKASLAKPKNKSLIARLGAQGGFRVNKGRGDSGKHVHSIKKDVQSKHIHCSGMAMPELEKISRPCKSQVKNVRGDDSVLTRSKPNMSISGRKRGGEKMDTTAVQHPSKKSRKQQASSGNQKNIIIGYQKKIKNGKQPFAPSKTEPTVTSRDHAYVTEAMPTHPSSTAVNVNFPSSSNHAATAAAYQEPAYAIGSVLNHPNSIVGTRAGSILGERHGLYPNGYEYSGHGYSSLLRSADYATGLSSIRSSYPNYLSYLDYQADRLYPLSVDGYLLRRAQYYYL